MKHESRTTTRCDREGEGSGRTKDGDEMQCGILDRTVDLHGRSLDEMSIVPELDLACW